jgi:hypothetical protein
MSAAAVDQSLPSDFTWCVDRELVPPLSGYLAEYVRDGCGAEPTDYRLMPISAATQQFAETGCHCLTDCAFELQAKYEQFIPDDWGGRMDRGWRDAAVVGFNLNEGPSLDIEEIDETVCHREWAEPRLACLDWRRLLVRAVQEFARHCGAPRVTLHADLAELAQQCGFQCHETDGRYIAE